MQGSWEIAELEKIDKRTKPWVRKKLSVCPSEAGRLLDSYGKACYRLLSALVMWVVIKLMSWGRFFSPKVLLKYYKTIKKKNTWRRQEGIKRHPLDARHVWARVCGVGAPLGGLWQWHTVTRWHSDTCEEDLWEIYDVCMFEKWKVISDKW